MRKLSDCTEECCEYSKVVSKASVEENKLIFELDNKSGHQISKWKIDDCVLKGNEVNKCDYLLIVEPLETCYWIELKSEDFDHACLQIYSSIQEIEEAKNYKQHFARIVFKSFEADKNRIDNIRYTNQKKLMNVIGGMDNLKYKNKLFTETI